jgi:hypothetical protein
MASAGDNTFIKNFNVRETPQTSVAIGILAGQTNQGASAVAIGIEAGQTNQGGDSVAIGNQTGKYNQGGSGVAIGYAAGFNIQGASAVAIGFEAGTNNQSDDSVAIGNQSGKNNQGGSGVAIGYLAGSNNQGTKSIAIGNLAGESDQSATSIILNATGSLLNTSNIGTYIKPLRNSTAVDTTITTSNVVLYNNTTGELFYSNIVSTVAKTFVIDHPVDSSRYLVHACLEGPESGVYYRGKGTIMEGNLESATVTLPDYTRDFYNFTISITPIGKPRTFSVSEFENGKFEVFSTPGDFFWTVYATRSDIHVEPYKSDTVIKGSGPYRWIG